MPGKRNNPLTFAFADFSRHGGRGNSMGKPATNAAEADRTAFESKGKSGRLFSGWRRGSSR
ncbi:hypothetical protein [Streptomyces mutabilis]|uniref:Uncharacterized protein n=1 Tax=Streptomyces mutabilis TaxID=67332 RepID=A0A086MRA5_9ACTN|nr:hypothetical protein [Streptomyces mutabilis]KFG71423.1 hypothetical protein FM21_34655 [Streptomyces mutabilis]